MHQDLQEDMHEDLHMDPLKDLHKDLHKVLHEDQHKDMQKTQLFPKHLFSGLLSLQCWRILRHYIDEPKVNLRALLQN